MTLLILTTVFLSVALAASAAGALMVRRDATLRRRLDELEQPREERAPSLRPSLTQAPDPGGLRRVVASMGRRVPISPDDVGELRRRLIRAGYRDANASVLYMGLRVVLALALPLLLLLTVIPGMGPPRAMLLLAASAGMAYALPSFALGRLIGRRQDRITRALPDALDLLVICVEAGLGLNQALMRVGKEMGTVEPVIEEELNLLNLEMRAGKTRVEALKNLARRTGVDDILSLVSMLIQTDRFGTSVANSLRVFSESMRTKRRQRAEEAAAKTTIKIIFPLVVCVMPSLFVVVLGPGLIQIYATLVNT